MLCWFDGTAEEPLGISAIAGSVISLDFSGTGYTGLQYAHLNGAVVGGNLFTQVPNAIAPMLAASDPVIFVIAIEESDADTGAHVVQGTYKMHVEVRRSLVTRGSTLNSNVWAFRQQIRARNDLETIATAIHANPQLMTATGHNAEGLGVRNQPMTPNMTKSWRKLFVDADTQQFICALEVVVRDKRTLIGQIP